MRDSFTVLREACSASHGATDLTASGDTTPDTQSGWFGALDRSKWLQHVGTVLNTAVTVAQHSEAGDPVLVHCRYYDPF
jgi:hypothetical protein